MSRAVSVARVDVFTDRPFAGNPAAAVLDADGLGEAEMQAIAREMKAPGTAFLSWRGGPIPRVRQSPAPSDRSPDGSTRACRSTAPQCR